MRLAPLLLCVLIGAGGAAEPPAAPDEPALVLSDADGTRLFAARARPGDRFSIVFTHSYALSGVEEVFEAIPGGRFRLTETRYADFGAGLPHEAAAGQTMRFQNGRIVLDGYDREFGELWLRVGRVADHRLVTPSGETIHLNALAEPGTAVRVAMGEMSDG